MNISRQFPKPEIIYPLWVLMFLLSISTTAQEGRSTPPERIISMSPSVTETLFALGLGDKVIGVTRYCDFPPAAEEIAKVGALVDPNYEEILALQPDLVILLTSQSDSKRELEKLNIQTLTVPHETISDIHETIRSIGEVCGAERQAAALLKSITNRVEDIRQKVEGKKRPSVLICIGRDIKSGKLAGMYMAGRNGFYDEIIVLAGGVNAYKGESVAYPQLSPEGVIQINPDYIVDLGDQISFGNRTVKEIAAQWNPLRTVSAVRNNRVHVIVGNYALRPSPRYIELLEELARLLHPDAFERKDSKHE